MKFNYAQEKKAFEKQWALIRQQYENVGMSPDAIEELHDFDWDWFKSRRRYINHLVDLPDGITVEDFPQADAERSVGDTPLRYGAICASADRYRWLDEIEDEKLLRKLAVLNRDDVELLTQLAFEERTQREVAQKTGRSAMSVSKQLHKIKKFLQ